MQLPGVLERPFVLIDPRTKLALLFFVGFFTFTFPGLVLEIGLFVGLAILLLLSRQYGVVWKFSVAFFAMLAVDLVVTPYIKGGFSALIFTIVRLVRMVTPVYFAALLLIRTTTVNQFIGAFRKMHLPDLLIIPLSVMFRFIPTVSEEWHSIRNAMRFRGIGVSVKRVLTRPMMTLEYMLIPLLMSTATISEELAAASLSRGLDSGKERSCITGVKLGLLDYLLLGCCVGIAVYRAVLT